MLPTDSDLIQAIDIIIEKGILSNDEIIFMNECKNSTSPSQFLFQNLLKNSQIAVSITNKIQNIYNDLETDKQ